MPGAGTAGGPAAAVSLHHPPAGSADDQCAHQGRTRSFPAERGQWATCVHCPAGDLLEEVGSAALDSWRAALADATGAEVHPVESTHLSLSRTVVLRYHQIAPFADALRDSLADSACCAVACDRLVAISNDEATRTFFALRLAGHCEPAIQQLVSRVDTAMRVFGLSQYYSDPLMHVSVLWALGDHTENRRVQRVLQDIGEGLGASGGVGFLADQVVCRSGNKEFLFSLS